MSTFKVINPIRNFIKTYKLPLAVVASSAATVGFCSVINYKEKIVRGQVKELSPFKAFIYGIGRYTPINTTLPNGDTIEVKYDTKGYYSNDKLVLNQVRTKFNKTDGIYEKYDDSGVLTRRIIMTKDVPLVITAVDRKGSTMLMEKGTQYGHIECIVTDDKGNKNKAFARVKIPTNSKRTPYLLNWIGIDECKDINCSYLDSSSLLTDDLHKVEYCTVIEIVDKARPDENYLNAVIDSTNGDHLGTEIKVGDTIRSKNYDNNCIASTTELKKGLYVRKNVDSLRWNTYVTDICVY
jgi:hypothetical protein